MRILSPTEYLRNVINDGIEHPRMFTQEPAPGFMARAPIPIIVGGKPHDYDHRTGDSTVTISMEDRVL